MFRCRFHLSCLIPMKQGGKIARLPAGQKRYDDIAENTCQHCHEKELIRVDRTMLWIHFPNDIRVKRSRCIFQKNCHSVHQRIPFQKRINPVGPVALQQQPHQSNSGSHKHGGICPLCRTASPVKPEDHDGTGSPQPKRKQHGEKHIDVIHLFKKQRANKKE